MPSLNQVAARCCIFCNFNHTMITLLLCKVKIIHQVFKFEKKLISVLSVKNYVPFLGSLVLCIRV